jgi:hypothetical protein
MASFDFWATEPRDTHGRWTAGGGSTGGDGGSSDDFPANWPKARPG